MKNLVFLWILMINSVAIFAQNYATKTGNIKFYSHTPVEDIEAVNKNVRGVLNTKTGSIAFALFIRDFDFESKLMQEHFNENYMESEKYPKASFNGTITLIQNIDFTKKGAYTVTAKGNLTIHGVTKELIIPGVLSIDKNNITVQSTFKVKTADYKIEIPTLVFKKIAEEIEVTVKCTLDAQ